MNTLRETRHTKQLELLDSKGIVRQRTCRTCQHVLLAEEFSQLKDGTYRADCKECFYKKDKVYKQENKDRQTVYRHNFRARKLDLPANFSLEDYEELLELANGKCMLTGKETNELEVEHVQALSKNWLGSTKGNIILIDREVNSLKRDKSLIEFIEQNSNLIDTVSLRKTLSYLAEANKMTLKDYLTFLNDCEELAQKNKEYWR